jgi:hypothetical protein
VSASAVRAVAHSPGFWGNAQFVEQTGLLMMVSPLRSLMRWGTWLVTRLTGTAPLSRPTASVEPRRLGDDELVARFIYSKRHFSASRPKPGAFDPSPYAELSVAHTTQLPIQDVWRLAALTLTSQSGRTTVYARADVPVHELTSNSLSATRDDDPFERHTFVAGWPDPGDDDQRKELRKEICLRLSQCPEVVLGIPTSPIRRP